MMFFVAFSSDGLCILSALANTTICIWESNTVNMVLGPLKDHKDGVNCTIFSPNGMYIVLASDDRTVHIWDLHTGNMVLTLGVHNDRVNLANFSPNRELIISASWDGIVHIWNLVTRDTVSVSLHGRAWYTLFLANGEHIFTCLYNWTILVHNSKTGEIIPKYFTDDATALSFTCWNCTIYYDSITTWLERPRIFSTVKFFSAR